MVAEGFIMSCRVVVGRLVCFVLVLPVSADKSMFAAAF